MANEQQTTLIRRYPGMDMLPVDAENPADIELAVSEDRTGDTLFSFLWRELGQAETVSAANQLLSMAAGDVKVVVSALESADHGEDPRAVLARSYPGRDMLPVDLSDHAATGKAVDTNEAGDTLFSFLWRELGDADGSMEDALQMAETALADIEAVASAFAPTAAIGR